MGGLLFGLLQSKVFIILCQRKNKIDFKAADVKSAKDVAVKVVQQLCPSVGVSYLSAALSNTKNKNPNLVLIVTFTEKRYQNLPIFEALYRHHFKNILYCGKLLWFLVFFSIHFTSLLRLL